MYLSVLIQKNFCYNVLITSSKATARSRPGCARSARIPTCHICERAVRSIKTLKRKLTSGHLIILSLVLLLFAADYVWSQCLAPWIYSVPADDVQVTELYELKNGDQDEISFIFPKEEKSPSYAAQYTHSCASIYYRGKSDDDQLMIWEEGQKVGSAPREIEQKVKEEYKNSQELDWGTFTYPMTLEP